MAFTGCESTSDIVGELRVAAFESVLYEDLNDPRGVALLTLSRDPGTSSITSAPHSNRARWER